ncbi:MAG: protein translocase subunit SecD, partial [Planctomycetota bacterium]
VSPFLLVCWTVAWVVAGFSPGFLATVSGELGNAALTSPLLAQADATPNAAVPDAAGDAVQDTIGSAESSGRIPGLNIEYSVVIGIIAAIVLCILPFFIGDRISKILRQPHLSTRIGWILFALTVPIATIAVFPFKLGVDLKGGTILTYGVQAITGGDADSRISAKAMAEPVKRRIDPSGVKEYVVRPYGDSQLEIIVPEVNQMEVERIKATLRQAGILQFAIVANNRDHEALRQRVMTEDPPNPQREIRDGDVIIGKWSRLGRDKQEDTKTGLYPVRFNPLDVPGAVVRDAKTARILNPPFNLSDELAFSGWMRDNGIADVEVLMNITPDLDVRGEDLASATTTRDQSGNPAIGFRLKDSASGKFFALTQENRPESDGFQRNLAIMMDNELLSAPQINSPIQGDGIIQGRFTRDEVESMVNILKSGRLPGALTEEPIAENTIDATLGKDTIRKGTIAIGVSLVIVLVFILVYYRFSGMVACLALGLNLLMTLGTMIWISQPLSLPGLAGLVLTVGMSVDANVLIFERIREELAKGAANRMAIRNGFDKATRTIVDANVTTLITALVLYGFGTDQIRGFAVTLILGIIFSMITAIYFAKTIFDLAERSKSLSLGMSNAMGTVGSGMTGKGEFDFMSRGTLSLAASAILIILGIASVFVRGGDILDIDLAGGSKVTAEVRGDDVTQSKIAAIVDKSIGTDAEGREVTNTVNGVDIRNPETGEFTKAWAITSGLKDANTMRKRLAEGFAAEPSVSLQTYVMDYTIVSNDLGLMRGDAAVRLVAYQDETEETSTEAQPPADAGSESADAGSAPVNGETADAGDSAAAAD